MPEVEQTSHGCTLILIEAQKSSEKIFLTVIANGLTTKQSRIKKGI
jgi:hypothetical protein